MRLLKISILNIIMMFQFWTGYGVDPEVTNFLDNYEWYFAPITNPDGYVFTHTVSIIN